MADNTALSSGSGGDSIRGIDKTGVKTQVVVLDLGGSGAESLLTGTLPVSTASLPLPAGASTSALQSTGNTSVGSIDTKTPALGQALAAAASPVVLTAAQVTTLTPPAAITGYSLEATQLLVKAKTDNLDVLLSTRLKAADTLAGVTTVAAVTAITNALPTGANVIGGVTQSGTWTVQQGGSPWGVTVSNAFLLDATFTTRINTLGQKTMANSTPVVLASDQAAVPVTVSTSTLPTNAAIEAGGNLAYLAQLVDYQKQANILLSAILMTLGNNGNGFVNPQESDSLSTLQ